MKAITVILAAALLAGAAVSTVFAAETELRVQGAGFLLQVDGQERTSSDLIGAELALDDGTLLRINSVRRDPRDSTGQIWLHHFQIRKGAEPWREFCQPDRDGYREGFPVPGRWDAQGRYRASTAHFALTCTGGALAKCVRFGYAPWMPGPDGSSMADLYEACVHMVRADYCGDGLAATLNGTIIDIYDRYDLQRAEGGADFQFEAGWSANGAVCVHHARIPQNLSLNALLERCPRLRGKLGDRCTDERARADGAILFNRSVKTP